MLLAMPIYVCMYPPPHMTCMYVCMYVASLMLLVLVMPMYVCMYVVSLMLLVMPMYVCMYVVSLMLLVMPGANVVSQMLLYPNAYL